MSNETAKKKAKRKFNMSYKTTAVGIICLTILLALIGGYLFVAYENSVLDIYAEQQDSYVQLVLDQINLQPELEDEEIITNILSSIGTSNHKYWTMSVDQSLLFVKDVLETNRYKGFTTPTLFESDSASKFSNGLRLNRVNHDMIEMDGDSYVASGVIFEYNGSQHKLVLLTNQTLILDNNSFLTSKIAISIYIVALLLILLLVTMILLALLDIRNKRIQKLEKKTEKLNLELERLEEELEFMDSYHTRWNLYHFNTMDTFVHKLEEKGAYPIVFAELYFDGEKGCELFLERAQLLLDQKVLRFSKGQDRILLLFIQYYPDQAKEAIEKMEHKSLLSFEMKSFRQEEQSLWEVYQEFLKEIEERGQNESYLIQRI